MLQGDAASLSYPSHRPEFQRSLEHFSLWESRLPAMACAFISSSDPEYTIPFVLNDPTIVLHEDTSSTLASRCGPRRLGATYVPG